MSMEEGRTVVTQKNNVLKDEASKQFRLFVNECLQAAKRSAASVAISVVEEIFNRVINNFNQRLSA